LGDVQIGSRIRQRTADTARIGQKLGHHRDLERGADRAARVVMSRADELDGNAYDTLTTAAAALEEKHPLAAALLRRAMIEDTLNGAKFKRYRYAAKHRAGCRTCDAAIDDYGDVPSHDAFVDNLSLPYSSKSGKIAGVLAKAS